MDSKEVMKTLQERMNDMKPYFRGIEMYNEALMVKVVYPPRWKAYPKHIPKKRGWYICSIRYGEEPGQAYVMDLFWDENTLRWKDNRRLDVYNTYEVYGYNDETHLNDKRIYKDNVCFRDDVVAFKKLPKIYK